MFLLYMARVLDVYLVEIRDVHWAEAVVQKLENLLLGISFVDDDSSILSSHLFRLLLPLFVDFEGLLAGFRRFLRSVRLLLLEEEGWRWSDGKLFSSIILLGDCTGQGRDSVRLLVGSDIFARTCREQPVGHDLVDTGWIGAALFGEEFELLLCEILIGKLRNIGPSAEV